MDSHPSHAPSYPGPPRWVKVLGGAALLGVIVLGAFAVMKGGHGPHRHFGAHGATTDGGTAP